MEFEMFDLFEQELDIVNDTTEYNEVNEVNVPMEIRNDVPGVDEAVVIGDPDGIGEILDFSQGDAVEGALGTCGLTSIANLCSIFGLDVGEGDVVQFALDNGLCTNDPWKPENTGGTYWYQQVEILKCYGIDAQFYECNDGIYETIAEAIESGRGVIAEIDAGSLWGDPASTNIVDGKRAMNHAITITGVARDANTGEIAGFYICDSGRGLESDANRFLSIDEFKDCCASDILGSGVVITDNPIR